MEVVGNIFLSVAVGTVVCVFAALGIVGASMGLCGASLVLYYIAGG